MKQYRIELIKDEIYHVYHSLTSNDTDISRDIREKLADMWRHVDRDTPVCILVNRNELDVIAYAVCNKTEFSINTRIDFKKAYTSVTGLTVSW